MSTIGQVESSVADCHIGQKCGMRPKHGKQDFVSHAAANDHDETDNVLKNNEENNSIMMIVTDTASVMITCSDKEILSSRSISPDSVGNSQGSADITNTCNDDATGSILRDSPSQFNIDNDSSLLEEDLIKDEQDEFQTIATNSSHSCNSSEAAANTTTTSLDYTAIEMPDTKEGIEELCPVCGDKVSGYHYGLLTCESCKGFFKRTVQNKKVYTCVADRSCQIDKTQRKRCPFCRFQKCLEVGMKLEAVRADRMRGGRNKFGPMYKRDRARKLQMMRQRQLTHPGMISSRGGVSSANSSVGITYATYSASSPIKEEIQSPFLSSSTSSPDSSPAPIQGLLQPNGTTIAISGAGGSVMGNQEISLWVGNAPPPAPGAGSGTNGNNRLASAMNGDSANLSTSNPIDNRVPHLIRQLVAQVDDSEWQTSLFSLLQNQTYNQCEVDLFELLCKVLDQNLFSQVDWARNSYFFKDLRVDDQMKLLQHSWSDMLIMDHLHQRIHNKLQDEMTLPNGQKFDLLSLALLGTTQFGDRFQQVMNKLIDLKFDVSDYICLKFVILLNPDIRNLNDRRSVATAHEQVKQTLIEYCQTVYPNEQDRYSRFMELLPELHYIADNGERFLYFKHMHGAAPNQTLLMEMLHTKRR